MRSQWDITPVRRRRSTRPMLALGAAVLAIPVALGLTLGGGATAAPEPVTALSAQPPAGVDAPAGNEQGLTAVAGVADATSTGAAAAAAPGRGAAGAAPRQGATGGDPPTPAGQPPVLEDVPGEWIVELAPGQPADAVAAEHSAEQDAEVHEVYTAAIDGYAAHMTDEQAEAVASDPRVVSVTRDRVFHATAQGIPPGIARSEALGIAPKVSGAADVDADIAVIDTGIDPNHADLNYRAGKNCISSSKAPADDEGHGTHVAGTAAARDNGSDVVGVAPGARVWAVKVLNSNGSGTTSSIVCGINWVTQNASTFEVATMSLGGSGRDSSCGSGDSMHNAICNLVNAGVPVTVAAGNEGENAANHVPAAYDEVITVSAYADFDGKPGALAAGKCSEKDDTFAYFSNYGNDVDITAPGVCVTSTKKGGGTTTMSGTSMATPHVAGAVADYMAKFGKVSPTAVKNALQANGTSDWTGDPDGVHEKALNLEFLGGTGLISGGGTGTTTSTTSTTRPPSSTTTTSTTTPSSSPIKVTLTRTTDSVGNSKTKIEWTGATGTNVDIFRDATFLETTPNDGVSGDKFGAVVHGTYTYKVCNAGTNVCGTATVTYP